MDGQQRYPPFVHLKKQRRSYLVARLEIHTNPHNRNLKVYLFILVSGATDTGCPAAVASGFRLIEEDIRYPSKLHWHHNWGYLWYFGENSGDHCAIYIVIPAMIQKLLANTWAWVHRLITMSRRRWKNIIVPGRLQMALTMPIFLPISGASPWNLANKLSRNLILRVYAHQLT